MILIDNYDSFTYNVVQYLRELGVEPRIFKNDEITIEELKNMNFSSIVISPGPKNPDNAGISLEVIKEFHKTKKILGICLGHQCIAQYFGCKVVKAELSQGGPVHGKVSKIYFKENELFKGLNQGFEATRYHSLIVDMGSLTDEIIPIAFTTVNGKQETVNGISSQFTAHSSLLMALKHRDYPTYGVQFHPEAILTEGGKTLLSNFICLS